MAATVVLLTTGKPLTNFLLTTSKRTVKQTHFFGVKGTLAPSLYQQNKQQRLRRFKTKNKTHKTKKHKVKNTVMQNTITLQQQATVQISNAITKKEALKKNALFVAIISCIVLAVNL